MLRALAVDDELPALEEMSYLLRHDPRVGEVATAADATAAMRQISERDEAYMFDTLFLDVRMPGPSGVDLARFVSALANPPLVVFVSAHEDFAVTAFELRAVDYLLKPLREERLADALDRVIELRQDATARTRIPVELAGRVRFIERADIYYAQARGDYVLLRTVNGTHLIRSTLGALERDWASTGFVRIHRSILVAARHVSELHTDGSRTRVRVGGELLLVSRRQAREVRERLLSQTVTGGEGS
ncbi:LytR/AlgR family response regulator transcription factor [Salinactinospora qingdaonensis]